jgi:hypothetical protein
VYGIFTLPNIVVTTARQDPGKPSVAGRASNGTSILFEADAAISYNIKFI